MYNYDDNNTEVLDADDAEVIDEAERNIYAWYNYFSLNYRNGEIDKQFTLLSQWDVNEQGEILRLGIPLLQFNKLYDYTKKMIGEMRNITPNLQLTPKDDVVEEPDQELLELQKATNLMTNLMRGLSYSSQSQLAYQTAFANTIYSGYGAIQIKYEYEDAKSFNRKIRVNGVPIAEKAFFDPTATHPCKVDGDYCGVYEEVDRRTFEKLYPDIPFPSSFPTNVPKYFAWYTSDTITIVNYYCKKYFKVKLVLLDTGETIPKSDVKEYFDTLRQLKYAIPKIVEEREADDHKIMHYKLIKNAILECNEFPSKNLPVIFVDGDSFMWQGRQYTQSFVHQALDAQRFLNYTGIAIAQGLKNSRKEQFLVTPEHIRGFENEWRTPELYQGALRYNPDSKAPPPEKLMPSEIPQSLYMHYERAEQDIQSILGVYNQNISQPSQMNELAVNAKMQQGNFAVAVYRDNLIRAIEEVGRCVLDMVPTVYDTQRTVTLVKQDGTSESAKINQQLPDGTVKNDITKYLFDLSVEAGTSFAQQKETYLALLIKLISIAPQTFPLVADLIADNCEIPNRAQLVERFRSLVPPNILAKEKGEKPPAPPPQPPNPQMILAQQAMQQKQQENQLSQAKLQSHAVDQQLKAQDQQLEAARLHMENQGQMMETHQKNLENIANMYRAGVDLKGNNLQTLNKVLDIHASTLTNPNTSSS